MNYFNQAEADIQTLFTATSQGFTGDSGVAGNHLHAWTDALRAENNNALRPVIEELSALGEAIDRNDPAAMGKAFITLGNLTSQLALGLHSFAGLGDKLRELSQKLASAGGNLLTIAQQQDSGSAPVGQAHSH